MIDDPLPEMVQLSYAALYSTMTRLVWIWPQYLVASKKCKRRDEAALFATHARNIRTGPAGQLHIRGFVFAVKGTLMPDLSKLPSLVTLLKHPKCPLSPKESVPCDGKASGSTPASTTSSTPTDVESSGTPSPSPSNTQA